MLNFVCVADVGTLAFNFPLTQNYPSTPFKHIRPSPH